MALTAMVSVQLGMAVAISLIEDIGSDGTAWLRLAWAGVLLLTQPLGGGINHKGALLAVAAGVCWAIYILLTQRAGDQVEGVTALAVSMPVAAVVSSFFVTAKVFEGMTVNILLIGLGMAVLLPVVPYVLELLALRRLTTAAFGTLMSLEPALAFLIGFVVLHQNPGLWETVGIAIVVVAGVGAARSGGREMAVPLEVG